MQVLDRAIDLLMTFTPVEPALGLTELVRRTRLSKPTTFRLVQNLLRRGLLRQNEDGRYELGAEVLVLAASCRVDLRELARPILRRVRDSLNETTVLSVRVGDERIHIEAVESTHPVRRSAFAGERMPLYAGAGSKMLLASMSDDEIDAYLAREDLERYSPTTLVDPRRIRQEVAAIRSRGYSEGRSERDTGGGGVSFPVRDQLGAVVAEMHVSIPLLRYTADLRARCIEEVGEAAAELSATLGYRPDAIARKARRR
ncbi:MAG: IclR family transcriptional regulator [Chloroflexota bacterium]|nr:IclR family transcriptional regulator [Chloroflexota bacterium]